MDESIFAQNYFSLFSCQPSYTIDLAQIQQQLRALQKIYHPDKFVDAASTELNQALQISSLLNQAYTTLADPLARAIYLLKLKGVELDLVHATKFSPEFLTEQISWREQIAAAAQDVNALEQIQHQLQLVVLQFQDQLSQLFQIAAYAQIEELVKRFAFYVKLIKIIDDKLAEL